MAVGILIATVIFKSGEQYDYVANERLGFVYFNDASFYRCDLMGQNPQKLHMKAWVACPELIGAIIIIPFDPTSVGTTVAAIQQQITDLSTSVQTALNRTDILFEDVQNLDNRVTDLENA